MGAYGCLTLTHLPGAVCVELSDAGGEHLANTTFPPESLEGHQLECDCRKHPRSLRGSTICLLSMRYFRSPSFNALVSIWTTQFAQAYPPHAGTPFPQGQVAELSKRGPQPGALPH